MPKQRPNLLDRPRTRETIQMAIEKLLLDPENPRLASGMSGKNQEELLKILWTEMAVDELAFSIAANGFFQEEALFVVPADHLGGHGDKTKYFVVEGNRRLAAVILLRDEKLRHKLRATELPTLSEIEKSRLSILPVSIYNNREELWEYFGFRHINGPQPWDAYSKASYVAKVYEEYGVPLDEIARKIGDRHVTVKRLYRGYALLRQAEAMTGFDKEDRIRNRFYFSHLYTAADQPEFQRFLGIAAEKSLKPNPVPRPGLDKLKELMIWFYGSKLHAKEPVIRSHNPYLNLLR